MMSLFARNLLRFKSSNLMKLTSIHFPNAAFSTNVQILEREKPWVTVGTIGHVDHGKTTLTSAITKVLEGEGLASYQAYERIDSAKEEQKRGITINAATIHYQSKIRNYAHVDCPGHADFVKNMISGTVQMDGTILVVAATDGVMPQTKEHVTLAKQIGVKDLIVYINKVDTLDDLEIVELVELEVRELLEFHGYDSDKIPFIAGSATYALKGIEPEKGRDSILKLVETLDTHVRMPVRIVDKPFFMNIDKAVLIKGRGTVAVGMIEQGIIEKGKDAELIGKRGKFKTTITQIEMFHKEVPRAMAGDSVGVLCRGVKRESIKRGTVLVKPGTVKMARKADVKMYVLSKEEGGRRQPFLKGYKPVLYSRMAAVSASVEKLPEGKEMAMPGEDIELLLDFVTPIALEEGMRFTMRDGRNTVATGIVTKIYN